MQKDQKICTMATKNSNTAANKGLGVMSADE